MVTIFDIVLVMHSDTKRLSTHISPIIIAVIVLLICLTGSMITWQVVRDMTSRSINQKVKDNLADMNTLIKHRIDNYIATLYSIDAFFSASDFVSFDEFSTFAKNEKIFERYPGLFSLSFIERVLDKDKLSFVKTTQSTYNLYDRKFVFNITPDTQSSEYYVVKYVEPVIGRQKTIGLDYLSDPLRKALAIEARDSGKPVISDPLISINTQRPIFLTILPIYRNSSSISTVEDRRTNLLGFAVSVIDIETMFKDVMNDYTEYTQTHWTISRIDQNNQKIILFENGKTIQNIKFQPQSNNFQIANKLWILEGGSIVSDESILEQNIPTILLYSFITVSILISGYIYFLLYSKRKAERISLQKTKELHENEDKFQAISRTTGEAIFMMDKNDEIVFWNLASEKIFGYTSEEAIGSKFHTMIVSADQQSSYQKIFNLLTTMQDTDTTEQRMQMVMSKKTGEILNINLSISAISVKEKWHAVAIAQDVTEQTKLKEDHELHVLELERINQLMIGRELKMIELKEQLKKFDKDI